MINRDYGFDEPCLYCDRIKCECKPCRNCGSMLAPGEKCSESCIAEQLADMEPKDSERDRD